MTFMCIQAHLQAFLEYPEDREEIRLMLVQRHKGFTCACGGLKPAAALFCYGCDAELEAAGFTMDIYRCMRSIRAAASWEGAFEYVDYDMLCDASFAIRTGRWDGKRQRRSLEAA